MESMDAAANILCICSQGLISLLSCYRCQLSWQF